MLVSQRAASLVAEHVTLYALAKKAFWSYVRSMSLMPKDGIWSDLQIRDFHLEEYAHSLGLPNIPGDLDKVLQNVPSREGLRVTKNVNRKLQKLKEQIRLEKEEKRMKRKRKNDQPEVKSKTFDTRDGSDEEGNGLLIVKARHEPIHTGEDVPLSPAKPRKPKKIRIDGGNSSLSKHTIFEDDGTEQPTIFQANQDNSDDSQDSSGDDEETSEALRGANDGYLEQVRQRLEKTKELDKQEERERIRAKHKKKRMKEKVDRSKGEDDGNIQLATLNTPTDASEAENEDDNSISESTSNTSCSNDDDSSGSDDNKNNDRNEEFLNVAQQEDLALSLIRGIS